MQGCIQQLQESEVVVENILYALKESNVQTTRVGKIINRIRNSVRKKSLSMESVNLHEMIEESIKFINYEKNENEFFIYNLISPDISSVVLDKIQIQQVIINLLRNSIESLQDSCDHLPTINISCALDEELAFTVSDNGTGFSSKIFESLEFFPSTKENGMGIGLSICRSIIEDHGGKLILSNLPQGGACVHFTLPLKLE